MYAEVAWVLESSGTQVQPQVIFDPDYLPDYLSVSYDYDHLKNCLICIIWQSCSLKIEPLEMSFI